MSAGASGDVREFANVLRCYWRFDSGQQHTHSWHDREDFIRDRLPAMLDALVQRKVEEERERCAEIADTFAEVAKADARFDAQEDARFIAEQIRGGP